MGVKKTRKKRRDPFALLTEKQIKAEADRRLYNLMHPEEERIKQREREQIAGVQGANEAANRMLAPEPGRIRDAYSKAAQELAGLGRGVGGVVEKGMTTDEARARAFVESQGGTYTAPVSPAAGVDAAYYSGVEVPGSDLISQGAAAFGTAESMRGVQVLRGQEDIHGIRQKSEAELLDLSKQRPELRDKIMQELYNREKDKIQMSVQLRAQNLYELQFGERVRHDTATEKAANRRAQISEKNYNLQLDKHAWAVSQAEAENRRPNSAKSRAYGYIVDADGQPILDGKGNKIPYATGAGAGSKQNQTNIRMAGTAARSLYKDSHAGPPAFPQGPPTPAKHPMTFAQAQQYLVTTYGIKRAKARQLLVAVGFKPDGRRGKNPNRRGN